MATTLSQQPWLPIRGFDDSSPQHTVTMDMATAVLNMEIVERGLKKRDGSSNVNTTIISATATVWQMDTLNLSDDTSQELVNTSDGKVRNVAELSASVIQGFSVTIPVYSTQLLDTMIYAQGATAMRTWSGAVSGVITASPSGKYVTTHLESLWTAGIDGNLSLISKSATGDIHTWSGAGTADINVSQNDGQVIKGHGVLKNDIIIYKNRSAYKIIGFDSDTYQVVSIDKNYGCTEHRTIQDTGEFHLLAGDNGLYLCDGSRVAKVSDYQDTIWATRNKTRSAYMDSALFREKGEYHVSFPVGSATENTVTLVYYYRSLWTDEFGRVHIPCVTWTGINMASVHSSKMGSTNVDVMYYGDYSGFIKVRDTSKSDSDTSISSYIDSPMVEGASIADTVNLRRCYVPFVNNVGNVSAYYSTEENATSWTLAESMAGAGASSGDGIGETFEIQVSAIGSSDPATRIERVNYNGAQARRVKVRFRQDSDKRTWQINAPIELYMKQRGHKT